MTNNKKIFYFLGDSIWKDNISMSRLQEISELQSWINIEKKLNKNTPTYGKFFKKLHTFIPFWL